MGLIVFIISFDQWGITTKLMGNLIVQQDPYGDYTPDWYMNIGRQICVFIFLSAFLKNVADVCKFILIELKRFKDRNFKCNMK